MPRVNTYMQAAFDAVCTDNRQSKTWYVVLMKHEQFYGGPEEGGWWGTDSFVVAYQEYHSEKLAEEAAVSVRNLATELMAEAQKEHGEQCLREMAWLDERGLDADFLPEPDGPERYCVVVCNTLPSNSHGSRHYE